MINEAIKTPSSTSATSYNRTPANADKKPAILASKNVMKKITEEGICLNCFHKDIMIYPGSSFNLCLSCDKKQFQTKENLENYLISLGICPQCKQKDPILGSGSLFRTCIKCDAAVTLKIPVKKK